jgi:hypothetical protein
VKSVLLSGPETHDLKCFILRNVSWSEGEPRDPDDQRQRRPKERSEHTSTIDGSDAFHGLARPQEYAEHYRD